MLEDLSIVEGEYLRDLLSQPQAVADTVAGLQQLPELDNIAKKIAQDGQQRVVLTGMGASFHALHPLHLRLTRRGTTALMVETSELVHSMPELLNSHTLLVAVSQSGRSAEIIRLLERRPLHSSIVGITNTPDSALAKQADVTIHTRAGPEFSVSCKTYLTTLLALEWVGDTLCGNALSETRNELGQAAAAVKAYLSNWKHSVRNLSAELADTRCLFLTGRGTSLAAVGTGGLIIKESARFLAEGMSSAAFRHGPFEMLSNEVFVLVFSGEPYAAKMNEALVRDIRQAGGQAALISQDSPIEAFRLPAAPPRVRPILEILPVQMVSLALAVLAGREPGRFELGSKVTTLE